MSDNPTQHAEYVAPDDWHGWSVGSESLHVGGLPGRKSIALYVQYKSEIRPLAYFPTEGQAKAALRWIDKLARGTHIDGSGGG